MPRCLLLVSFLIACGSPRSPSRPTPISSDTPSPPVASPAPAEPAPPEALLLLHEIMTCPDMRNGWSGYTVFQVIDGPAWAARPGSQVIAYYGEAAQLSSIRSSGEWLVGTVTTGAITPATSWPNQCTSLSAPRYDGVLVGGTAFANEADARRALR